MFEKYKILLVAGAPSSGKDTVCEYLEQYHGFKKIAFADKLRELCLYLLDDVYDCEISFNHFLDRKLKESYIMTKNYEYFRPNGALITYRQFLRIIATDCLRENISKSTWVDYVKRFITETITAHKKECNGICISDWRFPNEYEEIDKMLEHFGNIAELQTIYLNRGGIENNIKNDHIEGLLNNFKFNFLIRNNETLEELFKKVDKVVSGSYVKEKIKEEEEKRGSLKFNELI